MIRALRRKFILTAMAAFGILLVLLVGGIAVGGYMQMENSAESFLESMLEDRQPQQRPQDPPMMRFGYKLGPRAAHMGCYLVEIDASGEITDVKEKGIWEPDLDTARSYAVQILETGRDAGKIGSYKYRMQRNADGSAELALLDSSLQIHMLSDLLQMAGLLSLACLAALFLILLPLSNKAVRSYAANIEKQKQFITNAGHEIKTPVAIIMSNVDAMELIQGENKWSRNIRGQTERMHALLQRLLFMARIDEGSMELPRESVELNALLGTELETYGPMLQEKKLRLDCDLSQSVQIRGSRDYLQQLTHMLLDNAVQYANEGGTIELKLERKRRRVRLVLANTVGMLPDCSPEALFDRFYRGDSARTQSGGGYGIGLSAARAICEMHRGRISAEYVDDRKISFTVELPLRP